MVALVHKKICLREQMKVEGQREEGECRPMLTEDDQNSVLQCPMSPPSIFCPKKLRNLEKSGEGDANDSSPISRLPDEIILLILNRLIDLKTLCFCYLVSKRFFSIVLQVDAISFASPVLNPHISDKNTIPSKSLLRMISSL
uniref:F-box domain-containing protein n=1 Tax=Lactuca sativa TaxID=4236 RepID=A0A9R1W3P6_LACSA|nr:hypothetical protein LSAT_V11C300146950 [Lactuca sativa]